MMYTLKRLGPDDREEIKAVFVSVFTKEPWCDDWSDKEQLDLYIQDLIGQSYSLTYGLFDDADELIGISLGYIKHWYSGTEYIINELCIKGVSGRATHLYSEPSLLLVMLFLFPSVALAFWSTRTPCYPERPRPWEPHPALCCKGIPRRTKLCLHHPCPDFPTSKTVTYK